MRWINKRNDSEWRDGHYEGEASNRHNEQEKVDDEGNIQHDKTTIRLMTKLMMLIMMLI